MPEKQFSAKPGKLVEIGERKVTEHLSEDCTGYSRRGAEQTTGHQGEPTLQYKALQAQCIEPAHN